MAAINSSETTRISRFDVEEVFIKQHKKPFNPINHDKTFVKQTPSTRREDICPAKIDI